MIKKAVIVGGAVLVYRELKRHDEHGTIPRFTQSLGGELVAGCGILLGYSLTGMYKAVVFTRDMLRVPA